MKIYIVKEYEARKYCVDAFITMKQKSLSQYEICNYK